MRDLNRTRDASSMFSGRHQFQLPGTSRYVVRQIHLFLHGRPTLLVVKSMIDD